MINNLSVISAVQFASAWSIDRNVESLRACGLLLKWTATSQVFLSVIIADLSFLNLTLNSVAVDPTYCKGHLLQETK